MKKREALKKNTFVGSLFFKHSDILFLSYITLPVASADGDSTQPAALVYYSLLHPSMDCLV